MKKRVFEPQSSSVCYKYTRNNTYNVPCIQMVFFSFLFFIKSLLSTLILIVIGCWQLLCAAVENNNKCL